MVETIKREWSAKFAVIFFILLTIWWIVNSFILDPSSVNYDGFGDWAEIYGLMAIWGGIWGLIISRKWGFLNSVMGRALVFFALGLFAQEFGQLSYAFHNDIYKEPGPYPSLGDIGYFGSIPLYIIGVLLLAKASGVTFGLKSLRSKIQLLLIPTIVLVGCYLFFLQGYEFDWSNPIKVFLDFGYPLGQSIYVSLALLTYSLSRGLLGGAMKSRILFILFALCVQFSADFTFLYQSSKGTWSVGGINDYMYLVSYFIMALSLIHLKDATNKLD